jgi:hypothetical protein
VGPAAAALAAAIADLISVTFAAAVVINCGSVSKVVIVYPFTTARLVWPGHSVAPN